MLRENYGRDLTDFPPSQSMIQGHFVVGSDAQIETHGRAY